MKKLLLFSILLFTLSIQAQDKDRKEIQGKINVDQDGDPEGINVSNITSKRGVFTNEYGQFKISVRANDTLVFTSIQYEQFTVIVTKELVEKGKLDITMNEGRTELEEVVVKPDLTGDVSVDVRKIKTQEANMPDQNSRDIVFGKGYKFRDDELSRVDNEAIDKGYLKHGLNFANIFRTIFASKDKGRKVNKNIDAEVRKVYNDDFFKQNLDIDRENINEFIYYAQSHGLTDQMLKKGNDLMLIQFLIDKSKAYKAQQKD